MAPDLKYGRNPGHVPVGLKDLTWYVAGALPAPPVAVPVPSPAPNADGTPWGMDGNDTVGDCGVAGHHHGGMCVDTDTRTALLPVAAADIVQYYMTYTKGQDTGVVLADFLAYVKTTGFFGRTMSGYAPVSVTDYSTLQFAVNAYGYAYTGIRVTDLMEQSFQAGRPWTSADFANGTILGGHCVPIVGYDSQNLYCVTWGKVQAIQYSAWHLCADEAWAVLWGEVPDGGLDAHGVSRQALEDDLAKLAA